MFLEFTSFTIYTFMLAMRIQFENSIIGIYRILQLIFVLQLI